jgi:hypothetical protein
MAHLFWTRIRKMLLVPLMMLLGFTGPGTVNADALKQNDRSDFIHIQVSAPDDNRQMPGAIFLHDLHTDALAQDSCLKCHFKKEATFNFKFKRFEDQGYSADKDLYHTQCIGCHDDVYKQGKKSGPRTGQCRLCHAKETSYQDISKPFGMDKSLHYRHVMAQSIGPAEGLDRKSDGNCGACHHEYDKALKKTVYKKGKEGTCRYCHKSQKTEEARSFKTVAHEDCVNCHIQTAATGGKAGPFYCAPCHDPAMQVKIPKLDEIPRINRNQPDAALMSTWLKDALETQKPSPLFVMPVAFNHLAHEKNVELCRACHHESMDACVACHTRTGDKKGGFITLDRAMHSPGTSLSCIGCHREKTGSKDCAGCHAQIRPNRVADAACADCHSIPRQSLEPLPENREMTAAIAQSRILGHVKPAPVADEQVPDQVVISIMADQYDGATMPHRRIMSALYKRTQHSGLASFFHDEPTSLCRGCHHFGPSAQTFPKCASCHELSLKDDPGARPGLLGAYHGQCIGCHQRMGIETPAATDCNACHKKRAGKTGSSN